MFVFVLQASWKRREVKGRNGGMIELRKQRVSLDVRGIVFAVVLAKVMFAVGGNKLWSHCEFCVSGGFGERRACLH